MADAQVTCINKPNRNSSHEAITHLGGNGWRWTRAQVIASIEAGTNTFFTYVNGKRGEIGLVKGPTGSYVRTHADGYYNNDLLALPECSG
jgi:hypothetical protein